MLTRFEIYSRSYSRLQGIAISHSRIAKLKSEKQQVSLKYTNTCILNSKEGI